MGMGGGIPDIGVRLTASGVSDVVNAFRQVRMEAKATKEQGIDLLGGAMQQLGDLIPAVSLGLFVGKIVEMGKAALDSAVSIGKLAEKTGAQVGTLSVLTLAAHDNEVSQDDLGSAMVKLAKNQELASQGSSKQAKAFAQLGISANDLKTKDPGQIFVEMSQKMAAMPDGATKANVAVTLLGKSGANLIPLFDSVGQNGGFDAAKDKAQKLGLYLDTDMIQAAKDAKDALLTLQDEAQGLATQFDAGLLPKLAEGLDAAGNDLASGGVNGVKAVGEAVGTVLNFIINLFRSAGLIVATTLDGAGVIFTAIADNIVAIGGALDKLAHGHPIDAVNVMMDGTINKNAMDTLGNQFGAEMDSLSSIWGDGSGAPKSKPGAKSGGDAGGSGDDAKAAARAAKAKAAAERLAAAKSAYAQALADNMLALQKTTNTLAEQEDKRRYDAGLLTVDQYYNAVEDRIRANATAEAAAYAAKEAAIKAMPTGSPEEKLKQQTAQAKLDTEVAQQQMKDEADLAKAEENRTAAKLADGQKLLGLERQLATASGDRFTAELDALDKELTEYAALLKKMGELTDAQIKAKVDAARATGTAKINFGRDQQNGADTMAGLNEGVQGIQDQAANGSISNVAADAKILALEQTRLVTLRAIGAQMARDADLSGDPAAIAAAQKYNTSLDVMQSKLKNVTTAQTYFTNQLTGQGYSDLVNFFDVGISGSKSFGAALGDLATSFEGIVSKMISQLLVYYAMMELVGWIAPNSSFMTSLTSAGPFGKGYAVGGYTGTMSPSAIAGVVHGQEYVFDAQSTAAIGPKNLDMIAAGVMPGIVTPHGIAASISSGYTASLAAENAASTPNAGHTSVEVYDASGQQAKSTASTKPDGSQIITIMLGAVAKDIKSGGLVHKTLTATYGVARQGVVRG